MFDNAILLGVLADRLLGDERCRPNCCMLLNPPDEFVLQKGDKLCAVARSKDLFGLRKNPVRQPWRTNSLKRLPRNPCPKSLLICNWRHDINYMFQHIDRRVEEGSKVTVLSGYANDKRRELLEEAGGVGNLQNINIHHIRGTTVTQEVIANVMSGQHFDGVIVASNDINKHAPTADARAAVCSYLVHSQLEDNQNAERPWVLQKSRANETTVITEIKERRSHGLLQVAGSSHYAIADELSGLMMVHLCHTPELRHFWLDNIFSIDAASMIKIVRVDSVIGGLDADGLARITFWDVLATCRAQGATPFAFWQPPQGLIFNPVNKDAPLKLRTDDLLVVLVARD